MKRPLSVAVCMLILTFLSFVSRASTTVTPFDHDFCATTYPSSYVTQTITIAAASSGAFNKKQSNKTLIINLPAGYEFNTSLAAHSVTYAANQSLTGVSLFSVTASALTINLSTLNVNGREDTIHITVQIKATASGSGTITRSGTLNIDGSSTSPASLGDLTSSLDMYISGVSIAQPLTTTVFNNSSDNQVLRIAVTANENCNPLSVTQLYFNTNGSNSTGTDNPATNLTGARVYYTGTSSVFTTDDLFGSTSSPNGAFSVTGSKTLSAGGVHYFWLAYNIATYPNNADKIDARCDSVKVSGTGFTPATPNPVGSRSIYLQTNFYSIAAGNWNDNTKWSYTAGGSSCSCQPNGSGVTTISHAIVINANRTVDKLIIGSGGALTGTSTLTVNDSLIVSGTGTYTGSSNAGVGSLVLTGSGSSATNSLITVSADLYIGPQATLTFTGGAGKDLRVNGDAAIYGTLAMGTRLFDFFAGTYHLLSGTGSITGSGKVELLSGSLTVSPGTSLTIYPGVTIGNGLVATNNGTLNFEGAMNGTNGTSELINGATGVINIKGALMTTGIFTGTTAGNTVNYCSTGAQTIKSTTYHHLSASVSGTKSLGGAVTAMGDLTIQNAAVIDVTGTDYTLTVGGSWINTNSAADGFNERNGLVVLGGSSGTVQQVSSVRTGGETFYSLTLDNTSGGAMLASDATVTQTLTLTTGVLDLSTKTLSVTRSAAGAIVQTAGYIKSEDKGNMGKLRRNIGNVTGTYSYPFFSTDGSAIPLTLQLVSGNAGYVTVSSYSTADNDYMYPFPAGVAVVNHANMIKRFWQIDKSGATANFTVTFAFDDMELPINTGTGVINMQRWNHTINGWDPALPGQVYDAIAHTVTVPGVTQFSPWGGGDGGSPLPVQMVEFTAANTDDGVELNWTTEVEVNNKQFNIERSTDAVSYEVIGRVAGANNSTVTTYYTFTDTTAKPGITYYYRLHQVDYDGKSAIGEVISVSMPKSDNVLAAATVYPNPNRGESLSVRLDGEVPSAKNVTVTIVNVTGKTCFHQTFDWSNNLSLDAALSPGLYFVKLTTDDTQQVLQLIRTE